MNCSSHFSLYRQNCSAVGVKDPLQAFKPKKGLNVGGTIMKLQQIIGADPITPIMVIETTSR